MARRSTAAEPADFALRQSYGKSIVFDYRYEYFHGDGYGKDYNLLNQPRGYDPPGDVLLMGNLLAFYEQRRLYGELGGALRRSTSSRRYWSLSATPCKPARARAT